MISINVMHKGDEVIALNNEFLAIRKQSGEVDIYCVRMNDDYELYVDPVRSAHIGFGNGTVEKELDNETTLYEF